MFDGEEAKKVYPGERRRYAEAMKAAEESV